jgi:hypothetical protein
MSIFFKWNKYFLLEYNVFIRSLFCKPGQRTNLMIYIFLSVKFREDRIADCIEPAGGRGGLLNRSVGVFSSLGIGL